MTRCGKCGKESKELKICSECHRWFCPEHIKPLEHDCKGDFYLMNDF